MVTNFIFLGFEVYLLNLLIFIYSTEYSMIIMLNYPL